MKMKIQTSAVQVHAQIQFQDANMWQFMVKTRVYFTPNRKRTQKSTKLNRKTETESKNTNHSHKRRKQKQGNSVKLYSFSCFIVLFILNVFFRENMIAGYYYLGTSNCKSISFPAYLFSPSPFAPGDRYFRL